MTEQKTFDYKGTKLVKVPDLLLGDCKGCFFENKGTCDGTGIDDRKGLSCLDDIHYRYDMSVIFIEAKEELVNKI